MKMSVSRILLWGYILFIIIGLFIAYIWDTLEWNQRLKVAYEYEQQHPGIKVVELSHPMIFPSFIFLTIGMTILVVPQILWRMIKERQRKAYAPRWLVWFITLLMMPLWALITYSYTYNVQNIRTELGLFGYLVLDYISMVAVLVCWLIASHKLSTYITKGPEKEEIK